MKRLALITTLGLVFGFGMISCKKCQTCDIKTTQLVSGFNQTVTVSEEYCGDDYNNAPPEGTITQTVSGIDQTVETTCTDN